jgi:hypothetical protein
MADESTPTSIEQRAQCLLSLPRTHQHEGAGHLVRPAAAMYLDQWRCVFAESKQASFRPCPTFEADVANCSPARWLSRQRRPPDIVSDDQALLGIAIEHPLREQSPVFGVRLLHPFVQEPLMPEETPTGHLAEAARAAAFGETSSSHVSAGDDLTRCRHPSRCGRRGRGRSFHAGIAGTDCQTTFPTGEFVRGQLPQQVPHPRRA